MRGRQGTRFLTLLLVLMAVVTGCEKKRKTRFVQGQGEYVYTINDFKGSEYTLKTGKKLTRGVTTKADTVVVNNTSVIRTYDAVEFSVDTDFGTFDNASMSNFQFFGAENEEYTVRVEFTEDNLVFFKVAPEERIPSNEMTYAEKVEGANYRVPLFGLPLSKYILETVKDERNKSSNRVNTYEKKFLKDSTHFSVKVTNPKYFETELKLDMFPSKFFDEKNEWFFEVTVVDRPLDNNDTYELGYQLASGKAKFYKTNKTLTVISQNTPDELKNEDPEKQTTILEIPAKWMDFRLLTTGESAFLKEEVFNDIAAGAKYWNEREFVQLQFEKILSGVVSTDSIVANALRVKRLEVTDEYMSFIVFDSLSKMSLHFSFAKENRVVQGQNYPLEDWKKFGFFKAVKSVLSDSLFASEEAQIKTVFVQRMYPKDNVITFHMTENTPKDPVFVEAIEAAVIAWDKAFVDAAKGTDQEANPIRVVFDKEGVVQNGDARYHKVSFYGYEVASGLLGYGPSVADDRNGETYSSTNHIYLRNYREQILRNLVKYVRYRLGVYNDLDFDGLELPNQVLVTSADVDFDFGSFVGGAGSAGAATAISFSALPADGTAIDFNMENYVKPDYRKVQADAATAIHGMKDKILDASVNNNRGIKDFIHIRKRLDNGIIDENGFKNEIAASKKANERAGTCGYMAGTALSFKEIEEVCMSDDNSFKSYVEELLTKNISTGELDYRLDDEKEVFYACAQKLMKPTLISTLVHEFGHNFGLTHNFAGSSDAANFKRDAKGVPVVRSTSVMDYSHRDADRGFEPGPYDIATIRYGYYNAVEIQDKVTKEPAGVVSIKTTPNDISRIEDRLKGKLAANQQLIPYAYCWDYDIKTGEVPVETPNCRRWDQGSDPVSQVRSFIDDVHTYLLTNANRFDNYGVASSGAIANGVFNNYLIPMKLIYDKYRYTLFEKAFAKGLNDPYFDIFTAANVEKTIMTQEVLDQISALKAKLKAKKYTGKADSNLETVALEAEIRKLPELAQYKLASEFIKDFYRQMIFSQDMYCLAAAPTPAGYDAADIQPFASLRTTIYNAQGTDVLNCEDENVLKYFQNLASNSQLNGYSAIEKVVTVGNPANDILYSADIQKLPVRNAVRAGYGALRVATLSIFANRSADARGVSLIQANSFFPSLLDEENFRADLLKEIRERYVGGVDADVLLASAKTKLGKNVGIGAFSAFLNAKLSSQEEIPEGMQQKKRYFLPYFEEETPIVQDLLLAYTAGAISPLSVTNEKIADVQVSQSPEVSFLNFIRTAPDAAQYGYFIAGSTAYYSKGAVARDILDTLSETSSSVAIAEEMSAVMVNGALNPESLAQVKTRVVQFANDFVVNAKAGDPSAKNVLFKVRTCVKDNLVSKYKAALGDYRIEKDPQYQYILNTCRKPGPDGVASVAAVIAKYQDLADPLLDFIVSKDKQTLSIALLESILTQVGLPAAADPKKDIYVLIDGALSKEVAGLPVPNFFESIVTQYVVETLMANPAGMAKLFAASTSPDVLNSDIAGLVTAISQQLGPYVKYRELFKKKSDILQNAIYRSGAL